MSKANDFLPHLPPKYTKTKVIAIQALMGGTANEAQQKIAVDYIINDICRYYDLSFFPDNARLGDFSEGKRFVANQIIKMSKLKVGLLEED